MLELLACIGVLYLALRMLGWGWILGIVAVAIIYLIYAYAKAPPCE
jgi:hypothetical protein